MHTVDELLHMHGYHEGTEQERLLLVFKDLSRARAESAAYGVALPPHMRTLADAFLGDLER